MPGGKLVAARGVAPEEIQLQLVLLRPLVLTHAAVLAAISVLNRSKSSGLTT